MTNEYHSKLISNLYKSIDSDEANSVLEDMEEVIDVCFLYPIYDAYIKYQKSYLPHVFINLIAKIDSQESSDLIKKIAKSSETDESNFVDCLEKLAKTSEFDKSIVCRAQSTLVDYFSRKTKYFFLYDLLNYLEKANSLSEFKEVLKDIFLSEEYDKNDRRTALNFYFKINPKVNIQYFIDNFNTINNDDSELILTRVVLTWTGSLVNKLIEVIKEKGSIASKLAIEQKLNQQSQEKSKQEAKNFEEYSNGKQIETISKMREKINELSLTLFKHKIFPDDETLMLQIQTVKDKNDLIANCSSLRDIIQNIEDDAKKHCMSYEDAIKHINNIDPQSVNKSINALHLYLLSKNIKVDSEMFGIKNLIKILSLLGAHQEDNDLIPILKKADLINLYNTEQWPEIHRGILDRYVMCLKKLSDSLSENKTI